uniref:Uncharacterized protein n=1 Tax=Anopheles maculatus TaxID=74869 RepID=A0A182STP8_9DIPT
MGSATDNSPTSSPRVWCGRVAVGLANLPDRPAKTELRQDQRILKLERFKRVEAFKSITVDAGPKKLMLSFGNAFSGWEAAGFGGLNAGCITVCWVVFDHQYRGMEKLCEILTCD